jgi:hypothetical protein
VDGHQFDTLTRNLASTVSRRGGLRLLAATAASLVALARGKSDAAAQRFLSAGEACYDSSQCRAADTALVCADNGFDYDGPLNCCTYEDGRCYADEHCCGTAYCTNGRCAYPPSSYATNVGDPCQSTDQCRRPQTGSICEWTASTGDSRCCWYEGSLCSSGAQCCGARACIGGVCQFTSGGSGGGGGNGGSNGGTGSTCTWEGCDCILWRDPDCRASCPLNDPCNPGLVCTGSADVVGTCVSQGGGATGDWCGNKNCQSWERCCNFSCGICAPLGGVCPDGVCYPCPGCDSGICNPNGDCAPY